MQYRKRIPITGSAGAGANYQIKLTVNSGNGTDGAALVYLNGKGSGFPDDLRVTDSDGATTIPFWIDPIESTSTNKILWIRPTDDLSSGTQYIYLYYGDPTTGMTDSKSATNTFNLYDDFEMYTVGDLNGQGSWTANIEVDVQTSVVKTGAKAILITSPATDKNAAKSIASGNTYKSFTVYLRDTNLATASYVSALYIVEGSSIVTAVCFFNGAWSHLKSGAWEMFGGTPVANTWYKVTIDFPTASTHRVFINDVLQTLTSNSNFTNIVSTTNKVELRRYSAISGTAYFDYLSVREKIATEPSVGVPEAEETTDDTPLVTLFEITSPPQLGLTVDVTMTGSAPYFIITESATPPSPSDPGWQTSLFTSYTSPSYGAKTLYAWAKNDTGDVSISLSDTYTFYGGSDEYQTLVSIMPGTKYAGNPFILHEPGTWKGRQVHYPHVIINPWDSSQMMMYYGGGDYGSGVYKIGIATAPVADPYNWTEYAGNPVVMAVPPDSTVVGPDHVFYTASTNEIWLYGAVLNATWTSGWQGLWKSSDGYSFTYYGPTLQPSGDEVMLGNSGYITEGDTWYCYYTYRKVGLILPGIRLATSTGANKGTVWNKVGGADLVTIGAAYDATYIEGLQAFKMGTTFVLFYNCYNGTIGDPRTGVWTSAFAAGEAYNGPFYKEPFNPVFEIGNPGEWDGKNVSTYFIGFFGSTYYFYYVGTRIKTSQAFTADYTIDTFTSNNHGLQLNDLQRLTTTGVLPAGLNGSTNYFIINPTQHTFQLSTTSSGPPVNITNNGSGVHTYVENTDGYNAELWDMGMTTLIDPGVLSFILPSASGLTVPVIMFTGAGSADIVGFMITESATPPAFDAAGWVSPAPSNVVASGVGNITFWPWVKDGDNNVSIVYFDPQTVVVSSTDEKSLIDGFCSSLLEGVLIR